MTGSSKDQAARAGKPVETAFAVPRERMEALAGPMTDEQAERLKRYGELVLEHARKMSLVSRRELGRLDVLMIDSAAVLAYRELPTGSDAWTADLGTGAGLPGIVLAILRPEARVALVDSRRSRIVFLKIVQRELDLGNVEIIHERIEALAGTRSFELCVAKALGKITDVLVMSLGVVAPGGSLVLFKGPKWEQERAGAVVMADEAGAALAGERKIELPGTDRATTFVEFVVRADGA